MRVFLTGASGLLGSQVCKRLHARGDEVTALSRRAHSSEPGGVEWVEGDPAVEGAWCGAIDGCDAVIHLAGESIAGGRWTQARKAKLVNSRVASTRLIANTITSSTSAPQTFVTASATGYYGSRGEELLSESSEPGDDFLAHLCRDWETAALESSSESLRVTCIRFGVVMSAQGGALASMLPPFRLGLGGPLGPRDRWFPWIHEADAVGLVLHALDTSRYEFGGESHRLTGPINAVAPGSVRMGEFASALGEALGRPAFLAVPLGLLRIPLGELASLLSPGQRVSCGLATDSGYEFAHPELADAFRDCLAST